MARSKDFDRYVEACTYPGVLDAGKVQQHLARYCASLGIERRIVRLDADWSLERHPELAKNIDAILDDFAKRRAARDALAALDARDARAALDALDARDARDALDARDWLSASQAYAAVASAKLLELLAAAPVSEEVAA